MTHPRPAQQFAHGVSGGLPGSERERVLASLTVLHAAKEQAVAQDRPAMLHCVRQLIKLQTASLRDDEAPAAAKPTTGAANPAYAGWLQADKAAREAERRLQAAWIAHSMGGEGPSQQLLAEVSRLRAIANDRLDAAIVGLAGESS